VHAHYLREMASDEKVDDLMKWFGLANPSPSPNPNPNPNQVDDLMKWRWALRGNFWFDRIKAAEMPLCVEDELMRRGAHTRHMSAMRRAAGSIAQDAHRERGEHLPISPYISLYLPTSPYISIHLHTSPYFSLYLPIPPCSRREGATAERDERAITREPAARDQHRRGGGGEAGGH
jgi:hypothetical protein